MKIQKDDNFLDLIPVRTSSMKWHEDENGMIHIMIPRKEVIDRLVRLFKKTPDQMRVDLDEIGSSAWKMMDGTRTIGEICLLMTECHGEAVEPVHERVGTYINILRNNKFITLKKKCIIAWTRGKKHDR